MKILEIIARIILGGGFVVFGANHFYPFIPMPPPPVMDDLAKAWIMGLAGAPKYLTIVKVFELVGGLMVLTGVALPLGLLFLAPLVFNIVYYNTFLLNAPGIDIVLMCAGLFLAWRRWSSFKPLFK